MKTDERPSRTPLKAPVEVPLGELRQHPGNPRRISEVRLEHLQRTLTAERGMLGARPLIALPDGTVIAGNQRLAAAVALGWESIPVVYADLDEEQAARWMLLDNRGFGEDDPELLAAMLREQDARGADVDLAGYLPADVDTILQAARPVSKRDPDVAPPMPAAARSRVGAVYTLGPHRLICGDARDASHLAELMAAEQASIVWTDPPYGVGVVGRTAAKLTIENDGTDLDELQRLLEASFANALEVCLPGGCWYVAAPSGPQGGVFGQVLGHLGIWRQTIIWVKDQFVLSRGDFHYRHENLLFGWRDGDDPLPLPEILYDTSAADEILYGWAPGAAHQRPGSRNQDTIWAFDRPRQSEVHPTMKPVGLIERALLNSSPLGGIVLDPFAGAGSTLIAAEIIGRRCFAMEIDPVYVDVIRQRYADYTGQPEYAP